MIETSHLYLWLSHFDQVRVALTVSSGWGCVEYNKICIVLVFGHATMCFCLCCWFLFLCSLLALFLNVNESITIKNVKNICEETYRIPHSFRLL